MKGSANFIPIIIFISFIIILIGATLTLYPGGSDLRCADMLTTPSPDNPLGGVIYVGNFVSALFAGCGPTWVLLLIFIPFIIAIVLFLIPFK